MKSDADNSVLFNLPTVLTCCVSLAVVLFTPNGLIADHASLNAAVNALNAIVPLGPQSSSVSFPDAVRLQILVLLAMFPIMTAAIVRNVRRLYPLQKEINFRLELTKYSLLAIACIVSIVLPTEDPLYVKLLQIGSNRIFDGSIRFALFWAVSLCVSNIYVLLTENSAAKSRGK